MKKKYLIFFGIILLIIILIIIFFSQSKNENNTLQPVLMSYVPKSEISKLYPVGNCCCEFLADDIINEKLMSAADCQNRGNKCIEVEPLRSTPHSCCPGAPGKNCESLIK